MGVAEPNINRGGPCNSQRGILAYLSAGE